MPPKEYTQKFKLDMDDYDLPENRSDKGFREDIQELKLEKLNQRMTLITILIPILIVVIIVVSYLSIKQKVVQTQTTSTMGVQNLSKDLESRFSSLSVRQAKLEDDIVKQTAALEKDWAEYAVQKKRLEDRIYSQSKQMADKKELSEISAKFNAALTALNGEMTSLRTAMKTVEESAGQNLNQTTTLIDEMRQKFDSLSQTTSKLIEEKLDRGQLDLALKLRDLKLQEQSQQRAEAFEREIASLKEKTDQLSRELNAAIKQLKELPKPQIPPKSKQSLSSPKPMPAEPPASSKQEKIVEQDLN